MVSFKICLSMRVKRSGLALAASTEAREVDFHLTSTSRRSTCLPLWQRSTSIGQTFNIIVESEKLYHNVLSAKVRFPLKVHLLPRFSRTSEQMLWQMLMPSNPFGCLFFLSSILIVDNLLSSWLPLLFVPLNATPW